MPCIVSSPYFLFTSKYAHDVLGWSVYSFQAWGAKTTDDRYPALPDGTFLILNGAHQGVAGFGLGSDPNFNAVLYDPTQAVGQRFSILNNTIVARMYHSEATVRIFFGRYLLPQLNLPLSYSTMDASWSRAAIHRLPVFRRRCGLKCISRLISHRAVHSRASPSRPLIGHMVAHTPSQ